MYTSTGFRLHAFQLDIHINAEANKYQRNIQNYCACVFVCLNRQINRMYISHKYVQKSRNAEDGEKTND